jgi:hypothetical protein
MLIDRIGCLRKQGEPHGVEGSEEIAPMMAFAISALLAVPAAEQSADCFNVTGSQTHTPPRCYPVTLSRVLAARGTTVQGWHAFIALLSPSCYFARVGPCYWLRAAETAPPTNVRGGGKSGKYLHTRGGAFSHRVARLVSLTGMGRSVRRAAFHWPASCEPRSINGAGYPGPQRVRERPRL